MEENRVSDNSNKLESGNILLLNPSAKSTPIGFSKIPKKNTAELNFSCSDEYSEAVIIINGYKTISTGDIKKYLMSYPKITKNVANNNNFTATKDKATDLAFLKTLFKKLFWFIGKIVSFSFSVFSILLSQINQHSKKNYSIKVEK